jgi:hypothetical protein
MAAELIPFLRQAVTESHSDLVFPKPDGSMMSEEVNLEDLLRRALARAGIVLGYAHVCRRRRPRGAGRRRERAPLSDGWDAPVAEGPPSPDPVPRPAAHDRQPPAHGGREAAAGSNDSESIRLWARRDSNPLPPASEAGTLSR